MDSPKATTDRKCGEEFAAEARARINSPWLRRRDAAAYLKLSEDRLATLASQGRGPRYRQPPGGRICFYHRDDLDAWLGDPVNSATQLKARNRALNAA